MTIFDNRKALWQWEFSQQAEKTFAAAADTAKLDAGADILLAKAMDGTDWISLFDPGNVGSVAAWQAAQQKAELAGVTLVPWVVPIGKDPAAEAAAHAQLGPVLMVDIEPYAGFWTDPVAGIPTYLQALRQGGVAELHVSLDPRSSALQALNVPARDLLVDGLHPQCYWTDFGTPALDVVPLIHNLRLPVGPSVYPVLPGDGAATDLTAVWSAAQNLGCSGVSVWRLGSMNTTQLAAFASLAMPQEADMTPDQVNAAIAAAIAPLQTQLDRLNIAAYQPVQPSALVAGVLTALDNNQPVAIGFTFYEGWYTDYENGLLTAAGMQTAVAGGHAVVVKGYAPPQAAIPNGAFLCQNSWGQTSRARTDLHPDAAAGDFLFPVELFSSSKAGVDAYAAVPLASPATLSVDVTAPAAAQVGQPSAWTAQATGAPSGSQLSYAWSFSDGGSATGQSVSYTPSAAGVLTGSCSVSVATTGASARGSAQVTVAPGATPTPAPTPAPPAPGGITQAQVDAGFGDAMGQIQQTEAANEAQAWWFEYGKTWVSWAQSVVDGDLTHPGTPTPRPLPPVGSHELAPQ